jgi:hypothetical protein
VDLSSAAGPVVAVLAMNALKAAQIRSTGLSCGV